MSEIEQGQYQYGHGPLIHIPGLWICKTCRRKGTIKSIAKKPCIPPPDKEKL